MNISLIHPSRGRAEKSVQNSLRWIQRAGMDVELIVSVDHSDNHDLYFRHYSQNWLLNPNAQSKHVLTVNQNSSVVEATNIAAKQSTGDIIIYLSDDFDCPENWSELVIKEFEDATGPRLLKVDDCLQDFHVRVLTIPMMNRALYERLGYFWHPDYKSMFVDEDLWWTAHKLGALHYAEHLKFEHNHVSVGKADDDDTYRRSAANWKQGEELFNRRRRMGFPV